MCNSQAATTGFLRYWPCSMPSCQKESARVLLAPPAHPAFCRRSKKPHFLSTCTAYWVTLSVRGEVPAWACENYPKDPFSDTWYSVFSSPKLSCIIIIVGKTFFPFWIRQLTQSCRVMRSSKKRWNDGVRIKCKQILLRWGYSAQGKRNGPWIYGLLKRQIIANIFQKANFHHRNTHRYNKVIFCSNKDFSFYRC